MIIIDPQIGKLMLPCCGPIGDRVIPSYIFCTRCTAITCSTAGPSRSGNRGLLIPDGLPGAAAFRFKKHGITLGTPPIVANYVERPEALRAMRDTLFTDRNSRPMALTALAGMGGIGRTVLAKALTDDEVVRHAFPDGIVWITVGREWTSDLVGVFHVVGKALGEDWEKYKDLAAGQNEYRTAMAKKAALVIVDDLWKQSDLNPFLVESKRSRLLFTTRDASIARFTGTREHTEQLLDRQQAHKLLSAWAGLDGKPLLPDADAIIDECGSLPLAISQIGAVLRGPEQKLWKDTLDLLRKADQKNITEQPPPGQESFFRAVEVSFRALAPGMQDRYKTLAVLLEYKAAPLPILQTLWGVNDSEARRISRHFVDRSLAQRDGEAGSIRLHVLQLDYVRAQYPAREALGLIHSAPSLSLQIIEHDPKQFASQMVRRLLQHQEEAAVRRFTGCVVEGTPRPWLRPTQPSLVQAGGPLLRTLEDHGGVVTSAAVTPGGRQAISASYDGTIKVWDSKTGNAARTLKGHSDWGHGGDGGAGGGQAISASYDKTLRAWAWRVVGVWRSLRSVFQSFPARWHRTA
jgi:hypothetical protein